MIVSELYPFYKKISKDKLVSQEAMKLNYRCKSGTVDEGYGCGLNKPSKSEKKQAKADKGRTQRATKAVKGAGKEVGIKNLREELIPHAEKVKGLIENVKAEKAAGKVSISTYKEFKAAMDDFRNARSGGNASTSRAEEPKQEPTANTKVAEQPKEETKSQYSKEYSGLKEIQDKIKSAGGADQFFKDSKQELHSQASMPEMSVFGIKSYFDRQKQYGQEIGKDVIAKRGDITLRDMMDNNKNGSLAIMAGETPIGYVQNHGTLTTAILANEFRGIGGIGKWAMMEFYNKNPDMITKTGGLTPNGLKAYTKTLNEIDKGYAPPKDFSDDDTQKLHDTMKKTGEMLEKGPIYGSTITSDENSQLKVGGTTFKPGDILNHDHFGKSIITKIDNDNVYLTRENGNYSKFSKDDFSQEVNDEFGNNIGSKIGNIEDKNINKKVTT